MMHSLKRPLRTLSYAAALSGGLLALPAWAADFNVEVNHSRLHTLGHAASTVIVGNPAIANATVASNNSVVVFGRSYGTTNLIALDATGRQIANLEVNVTAPSGAVVTVNRGAGQFSYACAPNCVRFINPADAIEPTDALLATTKSATGFGDQSAQIAGGQD